MGRSDHERRGPRRRARGYAQDATGQWWAYISQDGKQHRYRAADEADAKAKRKELEARKDQHVSIPGGKMTLHAWLDEWLRTIVAPNKKPKTYRFYRQMCEFYISPRIGHVRLEKLEPAAIRRMLEDLRADDFAPRTVRHAYTVLRTALERAVGDKKIGYNPIRSVDAPAVDDVKMEPLTEAEAALLLWSVEGHRLYALYVLAIELGLRKGELLGLAISDVDLDARTILVRRQIQSIDGPPTVYEYTKNNRYRTLPLTTRQCEIVRARLAQIVAEGTQAGGLLFASEAGTPMSERNLDRHFKSVIKRAKLPDFNFHRMRHTCLSWLGDVGVGHDIIQAIAGHADADVTSSYVKIQTDSMRAALARLEAEKVLRIAA